MSHSQFAAKLKIGLIAFGGGYAVIALIESALVEKKHWLGKEEFHGLLLTTTVFCVIFTYNRSKCALLIRTPSPICRREEQA